MQNVFCINPQLDIPIYQQLVDSIRAAVKKGTLTPQQQLPTVQELSQELGIARGTVKRVYDELDREGLVEKVQGRGTFVRYQPGNSGSSKEQAMAAIDEMLGRLERMGFSTAEINIFLNLKLRERSEEESLVKVAIVECNPENLTNLADQLRLIDGIDLYSFSLDNIQQYPYKLTEGFDLVVTTAEHASYIGGILPAGKPLVRVALRLVPQCMAQIIKIRKGKRVGVLGYSHRFAQLLHTTCQAYTEEVRLVGPQVFSPELDMAACLQELDVVLLPKGYEKYCSREMAEQIAQFSGKCIECSYEMDEGSFLYLQEKFNRIQQEKKL